ncbi:MAG: hypothetical protein Q8P54_01035 [bacterium]|nr:hypothetical protein [bacterium]
MIFLLLCFSLVVFIGAPYLPSFNKDFDELIKISGLSSGQKLVDLGSGDGRLLIAAVKRGIYAVGYEINPILWALSTVRLLPYRKLAKVKLRNFWQVNLSDADGIFVFLIDHFMPRLERKLNKELKSNSIVISYIFKLPNKRPFKVTKNSFIYKF